MALCQQFACLVLEQPHPTCPHALPWSAPQTGVRPVWALCLPRASLLPWSWGVAGQEELLQRGPEGRPYSLPHKAQAEGRGTRGWAYPPVDVGQVMHSLTSSVSSYPIFSLCPHYL